MYENVLWILKIKMKIITFKKKKNEVINKIAARIIWKLKICFICKEKFENRYLKDKHFCKVRDHCHYRGEYRDAAHSICNLKHSVTKKFFIVFHNEWNNDHHFNIKS